MNRTRIIRVLLVASATGVLACAAGGCYRKVVSSRGIGADSTKLRSEYEHRPLDFMTTESRRERRDARPARERQRP